MSDKFPSIWLEINPRSQNPTIISGFYREWTHKKENSIRFKSFIHLELLEAPGPTLK